MGLSDQERRNGLFFSINRMNKILDNWQEQCPKDFKSHKIVKLVEQTWPALLSGQCNSAHWLIGSDTSNSIHNDEKTSPWTIAISTTLEPIANKLKKDNCILYMKKDTKFNAVDHLSIDNLLFEGYYNKSDKFYFQIYRETEHAIYYLRRYKDEFLDSFEDLNNLISRIQGKCFEAFPRSKFAEAYLMHEIAEILYSPTYPYSEDKWDVVTQLLVKHTFCHCLTSQMRKLTIQEKARIHIDLVKNPQNRVLAMIALCYSMYKYNHIRQDVEAKLAKAYPKESKFLLAEIKRYQNYYNDKIAAENKRDEEEYKSDPLACYGFASYDLKKSELIDPNEVEVDYDYE